jgi:hypothetical protein
MTAAASSGAEVTIVGYNLILPPGWERIPVRSGTSQAIKQILDNKLRALPVKVSRDAVFPYRVMIEGYLRKLAAEARKDGGLDLYLPVDFRNGSLIAASFVISQGTLTGGDDNPAPAALLTALAKDDDNAAPVGVDGGPAMRREHLVPADASRGIEYGSRRIDYVMPLPDDGSQWLIAAFSAVVNETTPDWFTKLLVELFDAIMSTFRWATTDSCDIMTQRSCR